MGEWVYVVGVCRVCSPFGRGVHRQKGGWPKPKRQTLTHTQASVPTLPNRHALIHKFHTYPPTRWPGGGPPPCLPRPLSSLLGGACLLCGCGGVRVGDGSIQFAWLLQCAVGGAGCVCTTAVGDDNSGVLSEIDIWHRHRSKPSGKSAKRWYPLLIGGLDVRRQPTGRTGGVGG